MLAGHSLKRVLPAGVLTALFARACAPQLASEAPASPPVAAEGGAEAPSAPSAADAGEASVDAGDDSSPDAAVEAALDAAPAPAEPRLSIEKPYLTWARPRPKGAVAAGAHDELVGRWNVGGTSSPDFPSNRPGFHPGTRVRVDPRLLSGRLPKTAPLDRRTGKRAVVLSETSLLARSRKHGYWPFRLCFERGVQQHGKLKGGETVLRFGVDRQGRIEQPRLVRTKLEVAEVADCLRERAREIELLPPPRRIEVELSVQVWPGDVPLPSLDPVPSDPALQLPLDADAIFAALEADRAGLVGCYAQGLARDPGLWGRLQAHVEADPLGRVRRVKEVESRFPDADVTACVLGRLKEMAFPKRDRRPSGFEIALRFGSEPERPSGATP